jgi:DNA-binding NtrC family response regulator
MASPTSDRTSDHARATLQPLLDALDHARDGQPRWVIVEPRREEAFLARKDTTGHGSDDDVEVIVHEAAEAARARGYVPIDVRSYLAGRNVLDEGARHRSLVLIAPPDVELEAARGALMRAASTSARPHVVLLIGARRMRVEAMATVTRTVHVREARARFGTGPRSAGQPLTPDVARLVLRVGQAVELAQRGAHATAERVLRQVGAALARRGHCARAADANVVLGRLLLERARVAQAIAAFEDGARLAEMADDPAATIAVRLWLAAARTDGRQLTDAESICRAVLLAPEGPHTTWCRALLARALLHQRRTDEAVELDLQTAADDPDGAESDPACRAYTLAMSVKLAVCAQDLFAAGLRAHALQSLAGTSADPLVQVIAWGARLRIAVATGDAATAAEALAHIEAGCRVARTPLRLIRARVCHIELLARSGRANDGRARAWLLRARRAAPPLLQASIDRATAPPQPRPSASRSTPIPIAKWVALVNDEADDREAVQRLLDVLGGTIRCARLDLCSADAGPVSTLLSHGTGTAATLGARAIEAGVVIGPESSRGGREIAVPIRLGQRILGAFAARWPSDVPAPAQAGECMALAAAIAAPRIDAMGAAARVAAASSTAIPELVGEGRAMAELRAAVVKAAAAPFSVLIEGESGVGKELVARAIHQLGPRRERRFCDVNCAALPDDLLESELFGHARGAFTGAIADRAGLFEEADGGTLFLDEVADLSGRAQAKLLRVVQQQEVRRVGETFSRAIDVRLVAAANRDMRREAEEGRFRQDLLYRLDVIRLRIPPLRERPEDVCALAEHFWRTARARVASQAVLSHALLAALARYHWPGNVRELQNTIAALAVEAPSRGLVRASLLPAAITGVTAVRAARFLDARAQFERRLVEAALARAGGSRSRAARDLGLSRQGLLKILARVGLR